MRYVHIMARIYEIYGVYGYPIGDTRRVSDYHFILFIIPDLCKLFTAFWRFVTSGILLSRMSTTA